LRRTRGVCQPIGALEPKRLADSLERYNQMVRARLAEEEEDDDAPLFAWGSTTRGPVTGPHAGGGAWTLPFPARVLNDH
jgi:hypothetical protein